MMKMKIRIVAVVAIIIFTLIGLTVYGQRQPPPQRVPQTKWEYKVVFVPGVRNMSEETMNKFGAEGWELVTYQAINNEGGTMGAGNYFFKRARWNQS